MSHQLSHAGGPQDVRGVEALKIFVREFRQAFPDFYDIIEDQGAEVDEVVTRFTSVGTHRGPLMGVEPTNKQVRWSGIAIDRVVGGKIAEEWVSWDMMGMLQQIGAVSWPS
ncbi:MAG TPA: ester cyclase [Candidatus Tectomicrobia bacterium]|nr:ester cyclase [Candidatus Tectomicrobia bacterium]